MEGEEEEEEEVLKNREWERKFLVAPAACGRWYPELPYKIGAKKTQDMVRYSWSYLVMYSLLIEHHGNYTAESLSQHQIKDILLYTI